MASKNILAKFDASTLSVIEHFEEHACIHTYIVCPLYIRRLHLYIYYNNIVVLPASFCFRFSYIENF